MKFSQKVLARLQQIGMSRADLAEKAGISYAHICHLLSGKRRWHEDHMERVSKEVGITINYE